MTDVSNEPVPMTDADDVVDEVPNRVERTQTEESAEQDYPIRIVPLKNDAPLSEDEKLYAEFVERYFTRNLVRDHMAPYVLSEKKLSKRDMTWAAKNYFPENPVMVRHPKTGLPVWLHEAHDMFLDEYRKYRFDSFRRTYEDYSRLVRVVCDHDKSFELETTFAQLIWFRWAIMYQFLEKCEEHQDEIKAHWQQAQSRRNQQRAAERAITGKKAKRAPLTTRFEPHMQVVRGTFEINY